MPSSKLISEENKTSLSREVGKFFYPDGRFDEQSFRAYLHENINLLKNDDAAGPDDLSRWLSGYLGGMLDYLHDKGMEKAADVLVRSAVEESSRLGIDNITLPTRYIRPLLEKTGDPPNKNGEKQADNKKFKIFQSALQIFANKGFHGATIDEIAALSGVGKGSVYRYFKSKEELLEELLAETYNKIIKMISDIFNRDQDVLRQIQEMIEVWIGFIEENHIVYRLIQTEAIYNKSGGRTGFYNYFIKELPMFKERILALNSEKKLKTTNFYTVFYGIMGFIDGVVHKWFSRDMSYSLKEEVPVILEVLFNGFVGKADRGRTFFNPDDSD